MTSAVRLVGAVVGSLGILVTACGVPGASGADAQPVTAAEPSSVTDGVPVAVPPADVVAGVCLDTTESVPPGVVAAAVEAVAGLVEGWAQPLSQATDGSSAPQPGLLLAVRKVLATSSLEYEGQVARVEIAPVPDVAPTPAVEDDIDGRLYAKWTDDTLAAERAASEARQAGADSAAAIRGADWSPAQNSEIRGCLDALASSLRGGERRLVVVSDFAQNVTAQTGVATFEGAKVLLVRACTDANACVAAGQTWHDELVDLGVEEVVFGTPETLARDLPRWIREGTL
jgi:hypothetical protein